jgi:hypothetical protein
MVEVQVFIQTNHLLDAISKLNIDRTKYKLEVLYCDDVNSGHYSLKDVVDWLLASHVHFIAAHLHQGISVDVLSSQGTGVPRVVAHAAGTGAGLNINLRCAATSHSLQ